MRPDSTGQTCSQAPRRFHSMLLSVANVNKFFFSNVEFYTFDIRYLLIFHDNVYVITGKYNEHLMTHLEKKIFPHMSSILITRFCALILPYFSFFTLLFPTFPFSPCFFPLSSLFFDISQFLPFFFQINFSARTTVFCFTPPQ